MNTNARSPEFIPGAPRIAGLRLGGPESEFAANQPLRLERSIVWMFPALFLTFALLGCEAKSPESRPAAKDGPRRVAVVVSTLNNPWFVVLAETAKARLEELGHQAIVFDSQNDTATEASHFDNVIAAGYDAVLLNATDSDGSVASVRKASAAGLPVFCIDREINAADAATAQLVSDNFAGCVELGQHFVDVVGREGEYAELLGLLGDNNTMARSQGFHSVVDRFEGLRMVAQQSADFDRTKALEVTESILQSHPQIVAIFCGNDAMAMGAHQAVTSANKQERIKIFGFDGAEDAVRSIRDGGVIATAMQFPKTMARMAATFADEHFQGRREFPQKTLVEVELVTRDNVDRYTAYGAAEQ